MSEKELLYQVLNREISNVLGSINPAFKMFSPSATKYIMTLFNDYIDAFIGVDNKLNTEAASEFMKEEINKKVEAFMTRFESKRDAM